VKPTEALNRWDFEKTGLLQDIDKNRILNRIISDAEIILSTFFNANTLPALRKVKQVV
jgi:hypothetical protein